MYSAKLNTNAHLNGLCSGARTVCNMLQYDNGEIISTKNPLVVCNDDL